MMEYRRVLKTRNGTERKGDMGQRTMIRCRIEFHWGMGPNSVEMTTFVRLQLRLIEKIFLSLVGLIVYDIFSEFVIFFLKKPLN